MSPEGQNTAALVLPNFTLGGAERQAVELALQLPRLGWRPVVLVAENHGPLAERLQAEGIPIYDLGARFDRGKLSPLFWWNLGHTVGWIGKICRHEKVDLIQSFLFWQNQVALPAKLLAPSVKAAIGGRRNTGEFKDRRRHYQRVENFTNRLCSAVVCNSEEVRRDVLRRETVQPEIVHVIPNGIDVAHYAEPRKSPLREHPLLSSASLIVGTIGNMKRQKRHDLFLESIAAARRKNPGVFGVIVGRDLGEEKMLLEMRNGLGLDDAVLFTGGVNDPAPYLHGMDAFLLTSDHEGMANVLLEAMAARVPIITRRVGGVAEVLPDAALGSVLDEEDPQRMADALLAVLAMDTAERERMLDKAEQHVRTNFSLEAMARRHVELYEDLLEKKK